MQLLHWCFVALQSPALAGGETDRTRASAVVSELVHGQRYVGGSGQTFLAWRGDLPPELTVEPMRHLFRDAFDEARARARASWNGILGRVEASHRAPAGLFVDGSVTIEHFDAGAKRAANAVTLRVRGSMTADGRFDVTREIVVVQQEGPPTALVHHTTFDGTCVRDVLAGGETGDVLVGSTSNLERMLLSYTAQLQPVFLWISDPFELTACSGVRFVERPAGSRGQILATGTRGLAGSVAVGSESFVIDASDSVPHPRHHSMLGAGGAMELDRAYSNYTHVDGVCWRPMRSVSTRYLEHSSSGRRIVTTWTVDTAKVLTADESARVPSPFVDAPLWKVWQ